MTAFLDYIKDFMSKDPNNRRAIETPGGGVTVSIIPGKKEAEIRVHMAVYTTTGVQYEDRDLSRIINEEEAIRKAIAELINKNMP